MPRSTAYICVFLLLALTVSGQQSRYVFNRLSVKDGLASNYITSIHQDHKGFMWFGTANGLQRYDGRKTVMYRSSAADGNYVPAAPIYQIIEDSSGLFWIRPGAEVGLFDPSSFKYRKAAIITAGNIPPRSEYHLFKASSGTVFLNITRYKILAYDTASHSFREDSSRIRVPENWYPSTIMEDPRNGDFWIGCDSGIAVFRPATRELFYRGHNPHRLPVLEEKVFQKPVTVLFIDSKDRFWITTWPESGEVTRCYDLNTNSFRFPENELSTHDGMYGEVHRFAELSDGHIWAYGFKSLNEFDPVQEKFSMVRDDYIDDYGIKFDKVTSFFEDREHSIWVGTDNGVFIFNPGRQFFKATRSVFYKGKVEEKELGVNAILEARNGNIYAASWGWGTFSWNAAMNPIPNKITNGSPGGKEPFLLQWSLFEDTLNNKLWIGCQGGGLIIHDLNTQQSQFYIVPVLDRKTIRQITPDEKGNIWLATQYGHLAKWSAGTGYGKDFLDGFSVVQNIGTIIYKLVPDRQGGFWVCSHNKGLYRFNPENGQFLNHYDNNAGPGRSLQSNTVMDIVQYDDSTWFISSGYLNKLNTRTDAITIIGTEQGLPSASTTSMAVDLQKNIWIGLMNGLCRYNPARKSFTLFSQRDGVINGNFEKNANLIKRNGHLIFGNSHDIVQFNPEDLFAPASPLEVNITDFKLFNTYLPADSILNLNELRLHHTQNSITIEFATLSYLQRDKTTYYYMLEGLDPTWIRADLGLYANYSLLPPGSYTFKVMCRNADGIDSPSITSFNILVEPPFWRSWWFISLIGLIVAGLVYIVHRFRLNRVLEMEKVRTRIARDLHDDMGSTLSTINILSEMAKMKVNKDAGKTAEYLNKISDNSSRMMEAMDDIVWSINPTNDSMQRVTARMREFATSVLEARNIEFNFKVDDQVTDCKLNMEERRDLFLVFKEAVNNLAKYSQCHNADISLRVKKDTLVMKIQDDGIGFDPANADTGNGLINMQKRAQALKGKLRIDSLPNLGSVVLLELPLT